MSSLTLFYKKFSNYRKILKLLFIYGALQLFTANDLKSAAAKHCMTGLSLPMKDLSLAGLPVPAAVGCVSKGWDAQVNGMCNTQGLTGGSVPFAYA